jgi:CNT family concentrative nucleoside transporter
MAAPGGLLMAKMMMPETEVPKQNLTDLEHQEEKPVNVIDAAATGALSGMHLAMNVGAMLLAFVALIALTNGIFGWVGSWFDNPTLTIQELLGYVFAPIAWLLGIPWSEAQLAGSFIGQKVVVNEFVAYLDFINYQDQLSEHSRAVITFALCGFANLSSIAILLGGLGSIAPTRRKDIAQLGLRAVLAGSMANLMSAAIAGFFLSIA